MFRFWNIVEYWPPYRDQIGAHWDDVVRDSISSVALAKDRESYELAMIAVIALIHDTHANLWSSLRVPPPVGSCKLRVKVHLLEGHATVSGYTNA